MKEIIALQEYTDKYISLYQGQIRNIENNLADKLIEEGIVAEHGDSTPSSGSDKESDFIDVGWYDESEGGPGGLTQVGEYQQGPDYSQAELRNILKEKLLEGKMPRKIYGNNHLLCGWRIETNDQNEEIIYLNYVYPMFYSWGGRSIYGEEIDIHENGNVFGISVSYNQN